MKNEDLLLRDFCSQIPTFPFDASPFRTVESLQMRLRILHTVKRGEIKHLMMVAIMNPRKFEEASVFGADQHEMDHIARVLVASHTFHPDWPYRDLVKTALAACYHFQQ